MDLLGTFSNLLISLVVTVCYIVLISFTLWMAIDAGKQDRFWWLTLVLGLPVIGPAVYYFTEKKHDYAKAPVHHVHTSETEEQHEVAPKKKRSHKKKETAIDVEQNEEEKSTQVEKQEVVETSTPALTPTIEEPNAETSSQQTETKDEKPTA